MTLYPAERFQALSLRRHGLLLFGVLAIAAVVLVSPQLGTRPVLTAPVTTQIQLKDMTWVEVRRALADGTTTVIVPTGGIEQNGPHMILGKHDYIVAEAATRIARAVGQTLVAPVVSYVPEGDYEPPSGHMRFPGTVGVPEPVFDGVLEGVARSLKIGGFKTIVFIGDHGQSQRVQSMVAERLTKAWGESGVRVIHLGAYYDDQVQIRRLLNEGLTRAAIGDHASIIDTSELLSVRPEGVDLTRHSAARGVREPTGVSGDPSSATPERGASLLDMRVKAASAALRQALGQP
jgi:creatinine amidohydrolase